MMEPIEHDDLLTLLETEIRIAGNAMTWARTKCVSESLVSVTLRRARPIGPVIARALGYDIARTFRKRKTNNG